MVKLGTVCVCVVLLALQPELVRGAVRKYSASMANPDNLPPAWEIDLGWSKDRLRPQITRVQSSTVEFLLKAGLALCTLATHTVPRLRFDH